MQLDFDGDDWNLMDVVWRDNVNPFSIFLGKVGVLERNWEYRINRLFLNTTDCIRS